MHGDKEAHVDRALGTLVVRTLGDLEEDAAEAASLAEARLGACSSTADSATWPSSTWL
jgi:hypothetical protein